MEQQASTSKVTVEYFDPHDVYKLLAPGLIPRLPLHNLHWQSHAGPLRSIDTLHVELLRNSEEDAAASAAAAEGAAAAAAPRDDGFQTQSVGGRSGSSETAHSQSVSRASGVPGVTGPAQRRHQIPGLRRTPYLKVLLVRCDDNDSYKSSVRSEIREWIKTNTTQPSSSSGSSKKSGKSASQEKHDAFEWLIVHVVIPNTAAATQPRSSSSSKEKSSENSEKPGPGASSSTSTSRWRTGSTPLLEKLKSDFNASSKSSPDRVAQIRIGINDLPYDILPRVVPAVPTGYSETEQDADNAWKELMVKFKGLILSSFDTRVTQYEDDIKERHGQRALPGWNFCTFFILKEGLARGFESVGLVEDALVGYDELSVGLDSVLHEQAEMGSPESHGGAMLSHTEELKSVAEKALGQILGQATGDDEEEVDLQSKDTPAENLSDGEIIITSTKKAYREMILANKVSVFDFRCYIFSRQIALLLRLGNASSTREELLAKIKEQQQSVLHGIAPMAPPPPHPKGHEDAENLSMLAEVCRRTLEFIPAISNVMRQDIVSAIKTDKISAHVENSLPEAVDNMVASFAFSIAQQILAQTSTKALPIPPSSLAPTETVEPKTMIPEPKTMMHPARSSSMYIRSAPRPPPSPTVFPGPGRRASVSEGNMQNSQFLKVGLEDLAARRADLYMLSRSVLAELGKQRGWSNGWEEAPMVGDDGVTQMEEISLDDEEGVKPKQSSPKDSQHSMAGISSMLLRTAIDNSDDFYRLYEIMTDKALRHYTVANYDNAVTTNMADLAVLKVHIKEYRAAASHFAATTRAFGENGWTLLELSMLVMYARCLGELQSDEEYVKVVLILLTKACAAERERLEEKPSKRLEAPGPDLAPIHGVIEKLCSLATLMPGEIRVPLAGFFMNIELMGAPTYHDGKDSCSMTVKLWSLLPEDIKLERVELVASVVDQGPCAEVKFVNTGDIVLTSGHNALTLTCNSVVPGLYDIDRLSLTASTIQMRFDKRHDDSSQANILKQSRVRLMSRARSLDINLSATKHIALDKDNSLDLDLSTGWNTLKSCELRIKPATGGLRLQTNEAKFVDSSSDMKFAKPTEMGTFFFGEISADTVAKVRFPYSVESDVGDVAVRLEATYVTESGESFYVAKSMAIPVALALGVNVQDVFKHAALFSRFNVTTSSPSPLRLFKSELLDSDLFESQFGVPPANTVIIFPKQPASLLYKITRKRNPKPRPAKERGNGGKTMYLKLYYSQLQSEVLELVKESVVKALPEELRAYERLVAGCVEGELKGCLTAGDLERAALLGRASTAMLAGVPWSEMYFFGLGKMPGSGASIDVLLGAFLSDWQRSHVTIPIPSSTASEPSSILIPVEIPSLSVVHTADIRLDTSALRTDTTSATPMACSNQLLPATLHLKWTRLWDTTMSQRKHRDDQEFSYEVTAPADTWLLGGRRKGHFVIPSSINSSAETPDGLPLSSTLETEAEIPLMLIPQREGWLPYPNVEVKEVKDEGDAAGVEKAAQAVQASEVDWRNLGESVRVVAQRRAVTVSLDASGPGGGPLILESEGFGGDARIVA